MTQAPFTSSSSSSSSSPSSSPSGAAELHWSDASRQQAFEHWLHRIAPAHQLDPHSVVLASADASFRRYLRVQGGAGSFIIMDAPPDKENCTPFVKVAQLMEQAGLHVPHILAWEESTGFMLLSDLGHHTLMSTLSPDHPHAAVPWLEQAGAILVQWQQASRPDVLPPYSPELLKRELDLFVQWYVQQHKNLTLSDEDRNLWEHACALIMRHNLNAPQVYVHRDFMARNLMLPVQATSPLGVLDFQDAVYGPITYDIASLMRDAFISWEEDMVLDMTIRYWEKARQAGLMDFEDWHHDFGSFYRSVEWMGLQRHLKVAGIFARLTLRDGKPKYLADAPRFIHYIRSTASRYRELTPLLRWIDRLENIQTPTGYAFGRV